MRRIRGGIVIGAIGLVVLGGGWWLAAAVSAGPERQASAAAVHSVPEPLIRRLRDWLEGRRPVPAQPVIPRVIAPDGGTCPVAAAGFCSLTPCVVPAGGGATAAVIVAPPQAVIQTRPGSGGTTCQGRPAPPRTLRVAGL